ncbi:LysM domain-containingprotein [Apiospora phragmitis]|uniref:LysM domain-containingprotein n=1 Tax=Apiospora phragmitis TaxID=2905665 RepID=A0ABR1VJX7_9PEZI
MAVPFQKSLISFLALCATLTWVAAYSLPPDHYHLPHQIRALEQSRVQRRQLLTITTKNVSSRDLQDAQRLVDEAVAAQGRYNSWRLDHPKRNTYVSRHSHKAHEIRTRKRDNEPAVPRLDSSLLTAAAVLAEHHAHQQQANGTLHKSYPKPKKLERLPESHNVTKRDSTSYWVADMAHRGNAPMSHDPSYQVFRDITTFGAVGDGVTDCTKAINAGTYLINAPINAMYYSQLVGNPNDRAIIKTAPNFIGLGAIQTDLYVDSADGGQWYVEQSNFHRQVRNLIIDIRDTTTDKAASLHWQVAQATSLTNVDIICDTDNPETTQMVMFTENGSVGFMSNVFMIGGKYGICKQSNTQHNIYRAACIALLWDWGWTWKEVSMFGAPIGMLPINPEAPDGQQAGSIYLLDSDFQDVGTAIKARFPQETILETSIITLDNIGVLRVDKMIEFEDGSTLAMPAVNTKFVVIGNTQYSGASFGEWEVNVPTPADNMLKTDLDFRFFRNSYFTRARPQYQNLGLESSVNVKDHGAVGSGLVDDTEAIRSALAAAGDYKVVFFPAGSYLVTSTVDVPKYARITGEVWSQIVAGGDYFADQDNPKVMLRVGDRGDVGFVEISDMVFTSVGALPGLIMVEWNVAAESQGAVGIWDSHFRVGGGFGTQLTVTECPPTTTIPAACVAAYMMLHITEQANDYFENMWAWVVDHDLDGPANTMVTVAVGRGILVEGQSGPTWMYATAAANVFAGMIQGAASSMSSGPFKSNLDGDPTFPDSTCSGSPEACNFSWAVTLSEVNNVTIGGAAFILGSTSTTNLSVWTLLINDDGFNGGLYFWNLITIGSVEMISNTDTKAVISAKNYTQAKAHPFWSALAAYLDDYVPHLQTCSDDDTSEACSISDHILLNTHRGKLGRP